mmetsp:Transcript_10745/g.20169  ORF Transcript_10745/g.20169 Transcript_10745/m.20169 type:complete len:818 (+) Transcript_10745:182-2635(+)
MACQGVRLVRPNASHTSLEVMEECLDFLRGLEGNIRVCSLVGTQREGKSTLLNLLHSRDPGGGFRTGHNMDPETTGLWVKAKPHPRLNDVTLVFIDSEGLDSPHIPQFYNWALSALTLLISDVFLYQSRGSIDARNVDRLDVILRVADQLMKSARHDEFATKPSFLWVLRDHHLSMKQNPKDEMLEKLSQGAHRSLVRCFKPDYDCMPLPQPAHNESLRILDELAFEQLEPVFQEEFLLLERHVLKLLSQRKNREMTGCEIADLVQAYCSAIGNKIGALREIEEIPTQAQMLATIAAERAVRTGLQAYESHMEAHRQSITSPKTLGEAHLAASKAAEGEFHQIALGDPVDEENIQAIKLLRSKLATWEDVSTFDEELQLVQGKKLKDGKLMVYYYKLLERFKHRQTQGLEELEQTYNSILPNCTNWATFEENITDLQDRLRSFKPCIRRTEITRRMQQDRERFLLQEIDQRIECGNKAISEDFEKHRNADAAQLREYIGENIASLKQAVSKIESDFAQGMKTSDQTLETFSEYLSEQTEQTNSRIESLLGDTESNAQRIEAMNETMISNDQEQSNAILKLDSDLRELVRTQGSRNENELSQARQEIIDSITSKLEKYQTENHSQLITAQATLRTKIIHATTELIDARVESQNVTLANQFETKTNKVMDHSKETGVRFQEHSKKTDSQLEKLEALLKFEAAKLTEEVKQLALESQGWRDCKTSFQQLDKRVDTMHELGKQWVGEEVDQAKREVNARFTTIEHTVQKLRKSIPDQGQISEEIRSLRASIDKKQQELVRLWDAISHVSCNVTEIHARLDM